LSDLTQEQWSNPAYHSPVASTAPDPKPTRRNIWFVLASSLTTVLLNDFTEIKSLFSKLFKFCSLYIKETSDKVIVLHLPPKEGYDIIHTSLFKYELVPKGDDFFLILPYVTRFSKKYIKRKRKLFKELAYKLKNVRGRHTFLTITYRPYGKFTLKNMYRDFAKKTTLLLDAIKKTYGYYAVIKIFEFMKNGLIHAHILLIDVPYIHPQWLTDTLAFLGLGKIKKIKEFRGSPEPALWYFFKYFTKCFKYRENGLELNLTLVLSWSLGVRTYSFSKVLYDLLHKTKFTFECDNCGFIFRSYCDHPVCPKCKSSSGFRLLEYKGITIKTCIAELRFYFWGVFEDKGVYGYVPREMFYQLYGAG